MEGGLKLAQSHVYSLDAAASVVMLLGEMFGRPALRDLSQGMVDTRMMEEARLGIGQHTKTTLLPLNFFQRPRILLNVIIAIRKNPGISSYHS